MDRFYWNYKTPEGFTDMFMFSDGRFLTGLTFEKSADDFKNRWEKQRQGKIPQRMAAHDTLSASDAVQMLEQKVSDTNSLQEQSGHDAGLVQLQSNHDAGLVQLQSNHDAGQLQSGHDEGQMQSGHDAGLVQLQSNHDAGLVQLQSGSAARLLYGQKESNAGMEQVQIGEDISLQRKLLPVFEDTILWLDEYFGKAASTDEFTGKGHWPDFVPAMKIDGLTPFRRKVMMAMLSIPYGQTMTYGEIAALITSQSLQDMRNDSLEGLTSTGHRSKETSLFTMPPEGRRGASARAVGGAVGWNPICLIIPCHRVLGAKGAITGYGGGISNKLALLKHEGIML